MVTRSTCERVGLIPAGGQATRISPLPGSKELFPVGFQTLANGQVRPKAVCLYLLEKMRLADVSKAYLILRNGKWDIPAYLQDGSMLDMNLAYLLMNLPYGAPYTLDQAYPFVENALIAFGFPDILFEPADAFQQLFAHQAQTTADIVLGLFRATQPQKCDMVDIDANGQARQIIIKPAETDLTYTWMMAVWTPTFSHFMHTHLQNLSQADSATTLSEVHVGNVIQAAIDTGLQVSTVIFADGHYIDIGTPNDLIQAVYTETRKYLPPPHK